MYYDAIASVIQKQFARFHQSDNAKPSSQAVAIWRAVHQLLENPVVFNDPLALSILGNAKSEVLEQLESHKDPLSSAMRMAIAVRSRFAEDEREGAAECGINQYVILGAGLDTYAYRSKNPGERVFEVDLPTIQSMKTARLQQQAIHPTCSVSYVPCDFEKNTLEKSLAATGFDKNQKAFFSCLGVVTYLDLGAFEQTLRFIASCAPGSVLTFDYIVDPNSLSEMERLVLDIMSAHLAEGGEPLKSFFDPQLLSQTLSQAGFSQVKDISPEYLNKRYLSSRNDGLKMGNVTRMYIATV
jgi:methyltransferase (TIGR00027 family)